MKIAFAKKAEKPAKNFVSTAYDFEMPLSFRSFFEKKRHLLQVPLKKFLKNHIECFAAKKVEKDIKKQKTAAEKILALLRHKEILSGDPKSIASSHYYFLKKINQQIKKRKPLYFTMLQFPFKIPNPLKTERILPDLGEIVYLYQLHLIATMIEKIYSRGVKFVILGESLAFRDLVDISFSDALLYRDTAKWWIKYLEFDKHLEIVELRQAEKKILQFDQTFLSEELRLKKKLLAQDRDSLKLVSSVVPTLIFSINVRGIARDRLMHIFNASLNRSKLNKSDIELYLELQKTVNDVACKYLAYHLAIKNTNLRERLWPHSIGVSPIAKPQRFGLFPLNNRNKLYPIHGVPVYQKNRYVTIHYKIDVLRNKNISYAYTLDYDNQLELKETDPFFYSEIKI